MENIDLSNLTYEELCELESAIAKRKGNFVSLKVLYIINDTLGLPHLCYRSNYRIRTNSFFTSYLFCDIFTDCYVNSCSNSYANKHSFIDYLKENKIISLEETHIPINALKTLWEQIKQKLLKEKIDKEQIKLDEKSRKLLLNQMDK